ncbi:MAG: DNA-binding response regulator [Alicyclobacillus sp. RIFOXYA1_FULL_53_8]|nr:MAG: DNA-binding response regulator [Alicyclobacillus sp. RIFOXYA1_FULL_53_8]
MKSYDILIADDSEPARKAVRMILNADPQFRVVAEATDGHDAIAKAKQWMPDLLLMDINMPNLDGLEATRLIKQELPYVMVVILSVSDDAVSLFEAIRSGAQGYLIKSLHPTDWIAYLHGILDGDSPVSRTMAEKILMEFRPASPVQGADQTAVQKLTEREKDILQWVATGATNREIAQGLFISENTVKNHLKNIMAKLHLQNRVQLATFVKNQPGRR